VIFLCENNLYSEMTPIADMVRVARLADRGLAYGIPGVQVDGMSVEAVADVIRSAADTARGGEGPTFVEAMTYRYCGHMPGDSGEYRTKEEVTAWKSRDPIDTHEVLLQQAGKTPGETAAIRARVASGLAVAEAEAEALAAPLPDPASIALGAAPWMETVR
jgi:pyruvate dehydrogenase E1 component alpha subunit